MITFPTEKKEDCCGCEACVNACPVQCISMEENKFGFRYPQIDTSRCVSCEKCKKVCCINSGPNRDNKLISVYAAYNKNKDVALSSSSGGVFWTLAEETIQSGGVVYGAAYTPLFSVKHGRAETLQDCELFKKSKYLPSVIGNSYKAVKDDIQNGRHVLFSGTACQIAGLYKYLGVRYDKDLLLTVGVVCHGVPSPILYKKYIDHLENMYSSKVKSTCWRDKDNGNGWEPNHISFEFCNGNKVSWTSSENEFQAGFLNNFYLRESCYKCRYAKIPRIEDITLGDFWSYDGVLLQHNQNAGISSVVISSSQGQKMWDNVSDHFEYHSVSIDYLKERCRHIWKAPKENRKRYKVLQHAVDEKWSEISEKLDVGTGHRLVQRLHRMVRSIKKGKA